MNIHTAKNRLLYGWCILSGPLLLIIIIQSMTGKYGGEDTLDSLTGVGWLFQAILPTLAVMIASVVLPIGSKLNEELVKDRVLFIVTLSLFVFYFTILYFIVLGEPFTSTRIDKLMLNSAWYLAPLQSVILALVSKFFIETA